MLFACGAAAVVVWPWSRHCTCAARDVNFPAGQVAHSVAPRWYLPGLHSMQYPGSCGCGMEPGGHVSSGTHWLDDAAPVSPVCLPPGHAWHAVFPDFEVGSGATAYFETGHATQARCRCATAAGLKRPAPHTWHVSMPKPFDDKP